jgi:phosphatidylserine decarboxylase
MFSHQLLRITTELTSIKFVSRLTGKFAKSAFSKRFINFFANTYNIRIDEAELTPQEYPSLNAFFTRRLKAGARKIDDNPFSLISPVDARVTAIGTYLSDVSMFVKGQYYSITDLLPDPDLAARFNEGYFVVLYLSPTDYHRIHSPIQGDWKMNWHVNGAVLPVHDPALKHVRHVLSRNERVITHLQNEDLDVAVIKVGAMNVASIKYTHPPGTSIGKGDELAYFEFGSTVVLLVKPLNKEETKFNWEPMLYEGDRVKMGEAIGQWKEV